MNDFLRTLEEAESSADLLSRALAGILELVPSNHGAAIVDASLHMVAYDHDHEPIALAYQSGFSGKVPSRIRNAKGEYRWLDRARWADYPRSEFYADFARPLRIGHGICLLRPPHWLSFTIQREEGRSGFSDTEHAIISTLNPHLASLLCLRMKTEARPLDSLVKPEELRFLFPRLSTRETQVAALLCAGGGAREIAAKLAIGPRTVETHLNHLYQKLDVIGRREAVATIRAARLREAIPGPRD